MSHGKRTISRVFRGVVVSDAMAKTAIVRVDRIVVHAKYKKRYTVSHRYPVHDERKEYRIGDVVEFCETRPLSRTKRWRVIRRIVTPSHSASV